MNATELEPLQGKVVLVKSAQDTHKPPVAMRGTLEVRRPPSGPAEVSIAVDFPQMFQTPAHRVTIRLREDELTRLLRTEREGTYEFTVDGKLG